MEKTLILIKPDAVNISEKIFLELDKLGKRLKTVQIAKVKEKDILKHYEEPIKRHGEHLIEKVKKFFVNQPIILSLYEGQDIIQKIRKKIGDINPAKAEKGTIRGDFCTDDLDLATRENRFAKNAVHASGSKEEFENEFLVWKDYFD